MRLAKVRLRERTDFLIGAPGELFLWGMGNPGKAYLFLSGVSKKADYPQMFVLVFSLGVIIILRKKRNK